MHPDLFICVLGVNPWTDALGFEIEVSFHQTIPETANCPLAQLGERHFQKDSVAWWDQVNIVQAMWHQFPTDELNPY